MSFTWRGSANVLVDQPHVEVETECRPTEALEDVQVEWDRVRDDLLKKLLAKFDCAVPQRGLLGVLGIDQVRRFRTEYRPPSIAPRAFPPLCLASSARYSMLDHEVCVATGPVTTSGQGLEGCSMRTRIAAIGVVGVLLTTLSSVAAAQPPTTPATIDVTCHGYDEGATRAYNCIPVASQ